MKNQTICDAWAEFAGAVMPENAGEVQRLEMQKAFYAGALCMFHLQVNAADDCGEDINGGAAIIDKLHTELRDWFTAMREAAGA